MTDPSVRERLATALHELAKVHPDMRFGQLVTNVAYWAKGPAVESVWDVGDEELLKAAEAHLQSRTSNAR